jgi:hypothetical protein
MTPYQTPRTATAGAVQIGLRYTPRPPQIYGDALTLQTALLDERTSKRPGLFMRFFGAFWRFV